MKNKKLLNLIIVFAVAIVLYILSIFIFGNKEKTMVNNPVSFVLSSQPRLEDDFYDYVNYQYLKNEQIAENESYWNLFITNAEKEIKREKKEIINEILAGCENYDNNSIKNKICIFYNSYNKTKYENKINEELDVYINLINSSQNIEEYLNNIYKLNYDLSINVVVKPSIGFVPNNLNQSYFTLDFLTYDYDLVESEIYTDKKNLQKRNLLNKYNTKMLTMYGYSQNEASKMVNSVQKMYEYISRFAIRTNKLQTGDKGYDLYTKEEIDSQLNNIKLDDFIKYYNNLYDNGKILVVSFNQLKSMDEYLSNENLEILKNYAIIKLLTKYSKYINYDFYKLYIEYGDEINEQLSTTKKEDDYIYSLIYEFFTDTISSEFVKKNFTNYEKEFYENLVIDEINAYKLRIPSEKWLSVNTKIQALKKMENMKYTVLLDENLVYVENKYTFSDESFLNNIINATNNIQREINIQQKNGNHMYRAIDCLDLNAFYSPNLNAINILAGWVYSVKIALNLNSPNLEDNYYNILGSLGFVIGHELSHALDSTGSKYDEYGNRSNWWTEEDAKKFNFLKIDVVKYYNKYNQYGNKTLNENIADLGAMSIVLQIAEEKKATIDDYKKIFESYALSWCSQRTPYSAVIQLLIDTHSPDKNRVNAVLSSTNKFYEVYKINEADKMYVKNENRVSIW